MNANLIINCLGGTSETARICGVKPQAVSQWRKNGIPVAWLMYLRLLRPDVFADQQQHQEAGVMPGPQKE